MKSELAKIVGKRNVSDSQADLLRYSKDHSLVPPGMPDCVVYPTSSKQVGEVLKWSNKNLYRISASKLWRNIKV